jgi:predicted Rossmann fold nucleotide-binding protein DprA/Smf involved in DNA uptake
VTRREFALWLAMTPGVGGRTVTRILARCDLLGLSAEEFQRLGPEALREQFGIRQTRVAERLASQPKKNDPILPRLDVLGVSWITMADAHYPVRVEQFDPDPPGVLFAYGNVKLLDSRTFCVLSSRNTSPVGLDLMEKLAEEGVLGGEIVVSGHDTPEYQRSALVPLRWGAPRILCLDRGLFPALGENLTEEPFRAARLWRYQFDPRTDLVVTPFRPEAKFIGVNNQIRDRLIAGLCGRLDFIEVAPDGNMEKLARMALKAGRTVRVSDRSIGYRQLVEAGAEVIH